MTLIQHFYITMLILTNKFIKCIILLKNNVSDHTYLDSQLHLFNILIEYLKLNYYSKYNNINERKQQNYRRLLLHL